MRHFGVAEFVVDRPVRMTRREKLTRLAKLVREHPTPLCMYHMLELRTPDQLAIMWINKDEETAFGVAVRDPVFRKEGLSERPSIADLMAFFEVTMNQLHTFSCDCGGAITREAMAIRIERIAA